MIGKPRILSLVLSAGLLGSPGAVFAAEFGTAEEARAMLERAVEALRQDEQQALERFTGGEEGFQEKDLYVFCVGPKGEFTAHGANPELVDQNARELTDGAGNPLGRRLYEIAEEGRFNQVESMWPRPGEQQPAPKTSYVTKVEDQICGVGYYEQDASTAAAHQAVTAFVGAVSSADVAALQAILAPEFQIMRANGVGYDREGYIASELPTIGEWRHEDLVATAAGDLLVARYELVADGTLDSTPMVRRAPRLTVFRRDGDRWLVVAHANFAAAR